MWEKKTGRRSGERAIIGKAGAGRCLGTYPRKTPTSLWTRRGQAANSAPKALFFQPSSGLHHSWAVARHLSRPGWDKPVYKAEAARDNHGKSLIFHMLFADAQKTGTGLAAFPKGKIKALEREAAAGCWPRPPAQRQAPSAPNRKNIMISMQNLKPIALLLLTGLTCGAAAAENSGGAAPGASEICAQARANILRARLKYVKKPMQDTMVVTLFFQKNGNDYHAELRLPDDAERKWPDIWMESFYLIDKGEQTLAETRLSYSIGDHLTARGTVNAIEFVEWPEHAGTQQRPACKISISNMEWDKAQVK